MLRGNNHTRNAQTLGEIPMNGGVLTLSYFQAPEVPIPPVRAPRTNPAISFIQDLKFILGPRIASPAVTSRINDEQKQAVDAQEQRQQAVTAFVVDPAHDRMKKFFEAVDDALQLNATMIAAEEGDPVDIQTLLYAIQNLVPLVISLKLPAPLILPLQGGGIGAEWHTSGMNIELRFRKPYDVYAVLEDVRGTIAAFHSRDSDLVHTRSALCELGTRSAAQIRNSQRERD
jgi:hypothetical protein